MTCGSGINTNTIFDCNSDPYYAGDAGDCPADWLGSQIIDFDSCSPVCGATVSAVSPSGVTVAGTSQLTDPVYGTFHFCVPAGTVFETTATAAGYPTFIYGEIQGQLSLDMPQFGMLSTSTLSAFSAFIPGSVNPADAAIVIFINDYDGCGGADATAGWSMSLTDENGNPYPDGGYTSLYVGSSGFPEAALTATSTYGTMIIYNIDTSIAQFPTLHVTAPPGSACQFVNPLIGFTGRIQVGPGIFSEQCIFIE